MPIGTKFHKNSSKSASVFRTLRTVEYTSIAHLRTSLPPRPLDVPIGYRRRFRSIAWPSTTQSHQAKWLPLRSRSFFVPPLNSLPPLFGGWSTIFSGVIDRSFAGLHYLVGTARTLRQLENERGDAPALMCVLNPCASAHQRHGLPRHMCVQSSCIDGQQRRWVSVGMPNAKTFEVITDRHPQPQRDLVKPAGPDAIDAFFTLLQLLTGYTYEYVSASAAPGI